MSVRTMRKKDYWLFGLEVDSGKIPNQNTTKVFFLMSRTGMKRFRDNNTLNELSSAERHIDFFSFERRAWRSYRHVAGLDEAGRGAWAGPVTAAAVVFSPDVRIDGVQDSKVLTPKKRAELFPMICEKALSFGIGFIDSQIIDEINILEATKKAMICAVRALSFPPDHLLIDGQISLDLQVSQEAIIDGDALSFTIAAASILAKVARDRLMIDFSRRYPGYGFEKHKGYGTKIHREALERQGCLSIHRRSYRPVQEFL